MLNDSCKMIVYTSKTAKWRSFVVMVEHRGIEFTGEPGTIENSKEVRHAIQKYSIKYSKPILPMGFGLL